MWALLQTFVLTPASVGSVANYEFHLRNKINICICIKYVSYINYQHVSVTFAIIIGVALQEVKEQ